MHITPHSSVAPHVVELSQRLTVRLSWPQEAEGLSGGGDFLLSTLTEMGEYSFLLPWSQLLLLPPLTKAVAGDCSLEFTENELTALEREGWLLLIARGQYPGEWRPPC
jgi:hypothetical protein